MMQQRLRYLVLSVSVAALPLTACGGHHDNQTAGDVGTPAASAPATSAYPSASAAAPVDTTTTAATPAKHHSKLAGAAIGAVAGHYLGGHAVAGAAAGALVQHERNKHP